MDFSFYLLVLSKEKEKRTLGYRVQAMKRHTLLLSVPTFRERFEVEAQFTPSSKSQHCH
jgi:hypothetical protein